MTLTVVLVLIQLSGRGHGSHGSCGGENRVTVGSVVAAFRGASGGDV